jgi:hypothetical protein
MKNIYNLLDSKKFVDHVMNRPQRNYLGAAIFPSEPTDSLRFEYLKGANANPVMGNVIAWGKEAPIRGRDNMATISGKINAIKLKMNLGEENMIKLFESRNSGSNIPQSVIKKYFDDVIYTYDGVENKIEYLRMQALCKGILDYTNDGYQITVDYLMPTENKPTVSTLWSDETNSNPEADIFTWMTMIKENGGLAPTKAITSTKVLNHMLNNANLRKAILGVNSDRLLTQKDLNAYFGSKGYPQVTTYDLRARDLDGNVKRFFDEDKFVILPGNGQAGKTLVAPTAESLSTTMKKVKTLKGITVTQWETNDPVDLWTKAAGAQIVTMPYAEQQVSATVI